MGQRIFLRSCRLVLAFSCAAVLFACNVTPAPRESQVQINVDAPRSQERSTSRLQFVEVPLASPAQAYLAGRFSTVRLSRFMLEEHQLYKTDLTNDILFRTDSASSHNVSEEDIQAVAEIFKAGGTGNYLYVVGHTDSRGDEGYNFRLSLRRAMSVADKLVNYGVQIDRIKLVPAGEFQPIAQNAPGGFAANRRVEILSADSRALISAFMAERDCMSIDRACQQVDLTVLSVERDHFGEIVMNPAQFDSIAISSPLSNDLVKLARDLDELDVMTVDKRYARADPTVRGSFANTEVRDTFSMNVIIRTRLSFERVIRDALRFDEEYIID